MRELGKPNPAVGKQVFSNMIWKSARESRGTVGVLLFFLHVEMTKIFSLYIYILFF